MFGSPQKQEDQVSLLNKELESIDADVTGTYKEIADIKAKLKAVIRTYSYLNDKSNSHKLDKAIRQQIEVLKKHEQMQKEIIQKLQSKATTMEHAAISQKMQRFKQQLQRTFNEHELLGLLVTIDQQLDKLSERKNQLRDKIDIKIKEAVSPSASRV